MVLEKLPEAKRRSPSTKRQLVSEPLKTLEANPADRPVAREVFDKLDRRMRHFRVHPKQFTFWPAVRNRITTHRLFVKS